jgi:hypothetical protein
MTEFVIAGAKVFDERVAGQSVADCILIGFS